MLAGSILLKGSMWGRFQTNNNTNDNMKTIRITTWIAAALLTAGTALAQGGPGGQGRRGAGYGGPPQTDEQRAARQEACQQANGGVCAGQGQGQGKGWRRGQCNGQGQGNGQGKGHRRGPRDGSGPRGGGADCPAGT
jgi:hypothetical protein